MTKAKLLLTKNQIFQKRIFDFVLSLFGLICFWWLILFAFVVASIETRSYGFFCQSRVGFHGDIFKVTKIKTMKEIRGVTTTVTQRGDPRITISGLFFRFTKIDELPQLLDVLIGKMSFVGPRPDVPGFADRLEGTERNILTLRPGITGPASLKYRREEELLAKVEDPDSYNREIIWPDKVKINLQYIENWSLLGDIKYILKTLLG